MFWTSLEEQRFLTDCLGKEHTMLEYGSGSSTIEIQDHVKHLVSVEHSRGWYNQVKTKLKDNVTYLLVEPNNINWEMQYDSFGIKNSAGDDGTFEDFSDYILSPMKYAPYDIVFIDGRARVACSAIAALNMLKPDGKIFIHDFGPKCSHPTLGYRKYYDIVLNWLEVVDSVGTMYQFKVKR